MKNIYFDLDGTLADLYGINNWLDYLLNEDIFPYLEAEPMVNLSVLVRTLHRLQNKGFHIGIISWLSKNATIEYEDSVRKAKLYWIKKHMPSMIFDEINIIPYGTPKEGIGYGYLFDDEENNRTNWNGIAYSEKDIIKNLLDILHNYNGEE